MRRRITQWEFWPYWLFYAPVYAHLIAAGVRRRSLAQFCCANPGIPFGGLLEYSKQALAERLPRQFVPATVVVPMASPVVAIEEARLRAGIDYPFILKPDRGERGFLVEKIGGIEDLTHYHEAAGRFLELLTDAGFDPSAERLLLQEYIDEPQEFGVMWMRHPDEPVGRVTSIVHKELLAVEGDGIATLADLIARGERTRLHEPMLRSIHAGDLDLVLGAGERRYVVEIGNHVRGATFLDATHEADELIVECFAALASAIPGFHVGRFDVRARDIEALRAGDFRVVEVNAVNSEPAHIYDPSNTLRSAYRDLLWHWREIEKIAAANRRDGCAPPRTRELAAAIGRHGTRRRAGARASRVDSA